MKARSAGQVVLCLGLTACYDELQFREEADAATCAWLSDCNSLVDEQECLDAAAAAWTPPPDSCQFHRKKAKACVSGLQDLACPGEQDVQMPAACDAVWDCE